MIRRLLRYATAMCVTCALLLAPVFGAGTEAVTVNYGILAAPYTYSYTGAVQTFNVPGGTEFVKARTWGSKGANSAQGYYDGSSSNGWFSKTFEYSTNNGSTWVGVPVNKLVNISVANGIQVIELLVRDAVQNETMIYMPIKTMN